MSLILKRRQKKRRNKKHVLRVGRCVEWVVLKLGSDLLVVVDLAIDNHGGASRLIWGEKGMGESGRSEGHVGGLVGREWEESGDWRDCWGLPSGPSFVVLGPVKAIWRCVLGGDYGAIRFATEPRMTDYVIFSRHPSMQSSTLSTRNPNTDSHSLCTLDTPDTSCFSLVFSPPGRSAAGVLRRGP